MQKSQLGSLQSREGQLCCIHNVYPVHYSLVLCPWGGILRSFPPSWIFDVVQGRCCSENHVLYVTIYEWTGLSVYSPWVSSQQAPCYPICAPMLRRERGLKKKTDCTPVIWLIMNVQSKENTKWWRWGHEQEVLSNVQNITNMQRQTICVSKGQNFTSLHKIHMYNILSIVIITHVMLHYHKKFCTIMCISSLIFFLKISVI
jgi:hypothetical protein